MKTREQCIKWCKNFLEQPSELKPNVEDCNFFNSIIMYLSNATTNAEPSAEFT